MLKCDAEQKINSCRLKIDKKVGNSSAVLYGYPKEAQVGLEPYYQIF